MAPPDTYPIQAAERELRLCTLGPPWPPTPHTPDEWIRRFGSLPLMHQPGEQWMYNTGSQVLGVLLERAAGKPLEDFLRERIFEPLGMNDTGFSVAPHQRDRFTTAYAPDPESDVLNVLDGVENSYWSEPPAFPNAGGGLVSTIDDFWAFVAMLLADGTFERRTDPQPAVGRADDHRSPDAPSNAAPAARCSWAITTVGASAWPCPAPQPVRRCPRRQPPGRLRVDRRHGHDLAFRSVPGVSRASCSPNGR